MALIINDHRPSGEQFEFELPGLNGERFRIPVSDDVITVEVQEQLAQGDYSVILNRLPEHAQKSFKRLYKPQLKQFVEAWVNDNSGN
ncbi:hypothetical protein [Microbacterium sp.]|uniref:hypothetical protein n=1 Tax=Microbacterium sp. TaxID=51671 RepID=UPI003A9487E5